MKQEFSATIRPLRIFLFYCALNLMMAVPYLILRWPARPESVGEWLVLIFLPVPLTMAGEWLFSYREFRALRKVDSFAEYVDGSKYRTAIVVTLLILIFLISYGLIFVSL